VDVPAAFYFDLASPDAYLAAERALVALPAPCEWQPISLSAAIEDGPLLRERVERRARELSLLPLVWPAPFPFDSDFAMLVATFAKRIGKTVAFALAAFRQAYAGGRALDVRDHVLIAAAACEMHPNAILRASETRGLREELRRASVAARELGVEAVPAVRVGEQVLVGEQRLEEAGALLAAARR
jgi:2-hydroxychromene-2-carboxylate isomerase